MFDDTVTVLVYPTKTVRGKTTPDLSQAPTTTTEIDGVDVQPGASEELATQRADATSIRWTAFIPESVVPVGVSFDENTVVGFRGRTYQVDGTPAYWSGRLAHYALALVDWKSP
jgi:hypothetical protein